jgi:hypothetical protein
MPADQNGVNKLALEKAEAGMLGVAQAVDTVNTHKKGQRPRSNSKPGCTRPTTLRIRCRLAQLRDYKTRRFATMLSHGRLRSVAPS